MNHTIEDNLKDLKEKLGSIVKENTEIVPGTDGDTKIISEWLDQPNFVASVLRVLNKGDALKELIESNYFYNKEYFLVRFQDSVKESESRENLISEVYETLVFKEEKFLAKLNVLLGVFKK